MEIKLERVVKRYYEALAEGKVLGRKCPVCGNVEWPPVYACNACGSYVTEWYEMSQEGWITDLYMPTAMSAKPAYKHLEPYAFCSVKTKEGPERDVMVLNITKQNEKWVREHIPYPVHMQVVPVNGYETCIFAIDPVLADGSPCDEPVRKAPASESAPAGTSAYSAAKAEAAAVSAAPASDTLKRLIALVAESYGREASTLCAGTNFQNDLKAPSVIFVGLVAKLEDEFDTFISITDAAAAKTIGGLANLIDGNPVDMPLQESPAAAAESPELPCEPDPDILSRLIELIAASYNREPAGLSAATNFQTDLKAPSVVFVGLVAKLEDEFDVFINITDASATKTIGGLALLIGEKVGA